jgi:Na+-transporting NADH:ubiquinone oxidoreductase subunit NqrF
MPRRTRGSGGAFFSRTKKQHRKNALSFWYFFFERAKKKYVQNIKNLTKKFDNRLFQHALANKSKFQIKKS